MKYLASILFLIAIVKAQTYTQQDIQALIQAVKTAQPKERFEKMNALKKALRSMNQAQRQAAIQALKEGVSGTVHKKPGLVPQRPFEHPMPVESPMQRDLREQQMHLDERGHIENNQEFDPNLNTNHN